MHKGSCLCGAVTLEVEGRLDPAEACHCTKCRKWSGHVGVSVEVPRLEPRDARPPLEALAH
jgi:hypothetical protein